MNGKQIDELIVQMENHVECWKQFNLYVNMARSRKFEAEDESHFLEVKSVLIQEFEVIVAAVQSGTPDREDIHSLIGSAASIRYLSEMSDGALRGVETQWHRIFIAFQALLGKLKVVRRQEGSRSIIGALFHKRAA